MVPITLASCWHSRFRPMKLLNSFNWRIAYASDFRRVRRNRYGTHRARPPAPSLHDAEDLDHAQYLGRAARPERTRGGLGRALQNVRELHCKHVVSERARP